ncbi:MAG: ribbon-helix-helix protein, CopG family [Nocardioidaceae bacterium]|nr:ribbon-helix-helix protein, CopG family [Nocardioidaceae bacterium]
MPDNPSKRILATARDGTPITEELAEELADEAEAGYDLSHARRVGRKSLAGGDGASPRVNFRLRPDLYEQATQRASSEGKTLSELAREALERYVAK